MAWICGLFRKGVIDWRQAEVLEVMKKKATDDYCVVLFADPEGIEPHVGATWEDRVLGRYVETSSGWNNFSNNEVRIENLPSDITEDQVDRQYEFVASLTRAIEEQLGELKGDIVTRFWFDTNSRQPSLLFQLDSDSVFESKMTQTVGKGTRIFRELTVRVEYEGGTYWLQAKPIKRAVAAMGEILSTGGATQERQREHAREEARRITNEDGVPPDKQTTHSAATHDIPERMGYLPRQGQREPSRSNRAPWTHDARNWRSRTRRQPTRYWPTSKRSRAITKK
jgi:hypothetical protein